MMQAMRANLKSNQTRSTSTLVCTFASSVLIPAAVSYTTNYTNLLLVLTISIVWVGSLARMWMDITGSVHSRLNARAESAKALSVAGSRPRTRLIVQCQPTPSVTRSAEVLAAYRMDAPAFIPGTARAPMSHPAGA